MDHSDVSNLPGDTLDAAAYWFARDQGGLMTAGERRQFEAWRRADAAHERAYQEMLDVWRLTQAVPDQDLRAYATRKPAPPRAVSPQRRRLTWGLAAAGAAAAAGVAWPCLLYTSDAADE